MTAIAAPVSGDDTAAEHSTAAPRTVDDVFIALAPAVHGYLRATGADDSEDVLSEVFVRVARDLARFRGSDRDLRRWVFTIAHHCLIDEHRRRRRQRLSLRRLATAQRTPLVTTEPFDPTLRDALLRLTADQRSVVTLRFVADLPIDEVVRITGKPATAVKSLQHRALSALASALTHPG